MIRRLLIANRGEIACRIIETCQRLGVQTVAVYSDADSEARHVAMADQAVRIGPAPARDSYLNIAALLDAAAQSQADAVHPGYGFLSENAGFARACEDRGLIYVGPSPETIDRMGNKDDAKSIMEAAGVPVVPGYHGENQDTGFLRQRAEEIGFPLMIKACAGGGGKGMRIVRDACGFEDALAGAQREAMSSFSDKRVLLERYLNDPRHVEVQVFADATGNTVHLFERECSVQRRYQKIIEETPCPVIDDDTRQKMFDAAIAAARAVDYRNAGTVEFIVDGKGEYFFMEMNTRLQVEHPVTEMVTGLDLVEWQLRVASGEYLPLGQDRIRRSGHAIEVRLYAENPYKDFLPATGTIEEFCAPQESATIRLDTGFGTGDDVGIYYDPMLAKLIVHAENREMARAQLVSALNRTALFGIGNNLPLLRAIARSESFAQASMHTGFLDGALRDFLDGTRASEELLAVAAVSVLETRRDTSAFESALDPLEPNSPWHRHDHWRLGRRSVSAIRLVEADGTVDNLQVEISPGKGGSCRYRVTGTDGKQRAVAPSASGTWDIDRVPVPIGIVTSEDWQLVELGGLAVELRNVNPWHSGSGVADDDAHPGSPLPGKIVRLHVEEGDAVSKGDKLLVLEGMKMEYTLVAKTDGVVDKLLYKEGDIVDAEVPLVDIRPAGKAA